MPFCPECGTKNSDDSVFCGSCGTKIMSIQTPKDKQSREEFTTQAKQPYQSSYQSSHQSNYQPPSQPSYQPSDSQYMQGEAYRVPPEQRYDSAIGYRGRLPAIRSWGMWFLGSLLLLGIPYIIYSYLISEDLNKLELASSHQRHAFYKSTEVNSGLMLLLFIIFFPAYYYIKFNTFHEHIKKSHHRMHNLPMSGTTIIILMIALPISIFTVIGPFIIVLVLLYADYRWQEILNQHILSHGVAQNY